MSSGEVPSSGAGAPSQPHPSGSLSSIRSGGTYFIGRYRIVDEIGIGGMASVHLARMDGPGDFQKWVAIKKIHPHLVEDELFVKMFLDEAHIAARISHPNVATVFDFGEHGGTYWIAMEYLHGEPLREVMRRTEELGTAVPPEIACRVIADAAEGLHAAHELLGKNGEKLGLVHRDVTPHNLFVTYDGVTKVVDFGIAKFDTRMSHTRAGTLKGKLAYMSPEQVHGEGIDRRTDIFALGVVLWELTTGQRLFRMENDLDTLAKVQECIVPRPSTLIRGYPVDLEKIVMKALAKSRSERFSSARDLSRALQSLLMRRGLFIASEEVASYTKSIFADRIQKREAHLRWAAEVTQTINVDPMRSTPSIASDLTEVPRSPSPAGAGHVGPATSMPPRPLPAARLPAAGLPPLPRARPAAKMPPPGPQVLPDDAKETAVALTAPRPAMASPASGPPRLRPLSPPRPAAGVPATPPPSFVDEPHPADSDGPTIQGVPRMEEARSAGGLDELSTLMDIPPEDRPRPRIASVALTDGEDLEADGDETVADGRAAEPERATAAMPPMGPFAHYVAAPSFTGEAPFTEPMQPPLGIQHHPYDFSQPAIHPSDMLGHPPYLAGMSGELVVRPDQPSHRHLGLDNRTMTVQRYKRRLPMWVVAALSCSVALLIAGIVIAVISTTGPASHPPRNGAVTSGTDAVGPFTTTRTAFDRVIASTASTSEAPAKADDAADPSTIGHAPAPADDPMSAQADSPAPAKGESPPAPPAARPAPTSPPAAVPRPARDAPTTQKSEALGALTIVCIPKCDQIVDNGTPLGPGHIFNRPAASGSHTLVLSAPNGVKKTLQVEVVPAKTKEVRISMDRP